MSDMDETLNRAFAQAIVRGSSNVVVSFPHRAGKSTIHRCINEFMKKPSKPSIAWDEGAKAEIDTCQPAVSEEERELGESRLRQMVAAHLRHISPMTYDQGNEWFKAIESELSSNTGFQRLSREEANKIWFEPIESRYDITADEARAYRAVFDKSFMDSMNADWQAHSYDSAWKGKAK